MTIEIQAHADPLIGATVDGRYRIQERIGDGGMAYVYRAIQLSVDRSVAIKVVQLDIARDKETIARFDNEARIIAQLRHPSTLKLFDHGRLPDGRVYLVTELLVGQSLERALAGGALSEERAIRVLIQICESLAEAHALGIVHRDLKPENIFLESVGDQELAKVLDFGIAKQAAQRFKTVTGEVVGTPDYMSPEQAQGKPVGAASDLYSLGVIAYRCVSGRLPFAADTPLGVLLQHVNVEPSPLNGGDRRLSDGLEAIILALLAKSPDSRPRSAADLRDRLSALAQRTMIPSERPLRARRRWSRTAIAMSFTLAVCASIAAALMMRSMRTEHVHEKPAPIALIDADDEGVIYQVPIGRSPVRGPADALVTIVEFADYQCPYATLVRDVLEEAFQKFGGKIRVAWKDYPWSMHVESMRGAVFAREARREKGVDGYWAAHRRVLDLRKSLSSTAALAKAALELGLDPNAWRSALETSAFEPEISEDTDLGDEILVGGTPAFYINGRHVRANDRDTIFAVIEQALAHAEALIANGVPPSRIYEAITEGGITKRQRFSGVLAPSPDKHPFRGSAAADALEIHEFCDYEDPICVMVDPVLRAIVDKNADRVRLVWRHVFSPSHERGHWAALAAVDAFHQRGNEGFWAMHEVIVAMQTPAQLSDATTTALTREALREKAGLLGLDLNLYDYELKLGVTEPELQRDLEIAKEAGIDLRSDLPLPRILIDGRWYFGAEPERTLQRAIDRGLAR